MSDVAVPSDEASTELYCIVHHGADGDPFWESFNLAAAQNVADLGLTNVEIRAEPDVEQHAKAIMDCIDRDASAIASSIPSLDGLSDALAAVYQSGAFLVTFNSGADFASQLGSFVHYGLDDRAAGEIAGREFNDAGATRTILCVVHETANVGLEDRCNGLASTYGGAVEQVQLPAGSLSDLSTAGAAIGGAIAAHQAEGVLVLNGALISAAVGAADFLGSGTKLGVIGRSTEAVIFVATERILFSISDVDIGQAVHVALALKNIDASPSYRQLLTLTSSGAGATIILMKPTAFNQDSVRSLPPEWLAQVCQLVATLAPDTEYELCNQ